MRSATVQSSLVLINRKFHLDLQPDILRSSILQNLQLKETERNRYQCMNEVEAE